MNSPVELADQNVTDSFEVAADPHPGTTEAAPVATPAPRPTNLAATNTFAVVAIILAFIQPIAAVVFGHIGMSQIKKNGDAGRGLAITALIVGYCSIAMLALFLVMYVGFFVVWGIAMSGAYSGGYGW